MRRHSRRSFQGFRDIFGGHKKSAEEDMEEKEAAQDEEPDEVSTGSEDVTEQAEAPEAETAAAAEPSEEFTDSEEIEAAEGSEEASDEPSEEQEEFSGQEADEIPLASGVENLSSGSMKLQAQEQQDKEEEEAYQEAEEAEAEKATEMSLSQSVAEIMKEKAAGNEESEEKPAGVPLNEEGKPDFSATIRMPELKIPKSMINVDPENASSSAEIPDASGIFGSIEDIAASVGDRSGKDKDKDFNLEDTILAAATQQGIDIPEEEKSPDVQQSDVTEEPAGIEDLDIAADEFVPEEPDAAYIEDIMAQISAQQEEEVTETSDTRLPDIVFDEDEEPVTEEDLQAAEAEFLNGPSGVQKPVEEEDVLRRFLHWNLRSRCRRRQQSLQRSFIMRNRWLQRKRKIFLMRKKNTVMTPLNSRKRMRMTLSAVSSVMILMKPWKRTMRKRSSARKSSLRNLSLRSIRKRILQRSFPERKSSQMKRNSFSPILLQFLE